MFVRLYTLNTMHVIYRLLIFCLQRVITVAINFGSDTNLRNEITALATDQSTTFYLNNANELLNIVADVARAVCPC